MNKTQTGKFGEKLAEEYLIKKGHIIIDKNFRLTGGEIDLISLFGNNLYIYEVKYRKTLEYGYGDDAINSTKIRKIKNTFEIWLTQNQNNYKFENIYLNAIVIDPDESIHEFEVM